MLYTGCEGSGGDRLVKAVWDMYQMEMFVKEKLEVSTGVSFLKFSLYINDLR